MLVKLSIISTKSKVLFKPSFTKYDDDASITTFITEKKFNVENVVEVLDGRNPPEQKHLTFKHSIPYY